VTTSSHGGVEPPITMKMLAVWVTIATQTVLVCGFAFGLRGDINTMQRERELLMAKRDLQVNGLDARISRVESRQDTFDVALNDINKKLERLLTLAEQQQRAAAAAGK
jgi:hypothetical protein